MIIDMDDKYGWMDGLIEFYIDPFESSITSILVKKRH